MQVQFNNEYLEKIFQGKAVHGKPRFNDEVIKQFKKTVLKLQYAESIRELRDLKGLKFEALTGNYKGFYSVRVDRKYRLILSVQADGSVSVNEILVIEELSNHYS